MRIACIATSEVPSRKANSIRVMKVCQSFADLGHSVRLWLPGRTPDISWADLSDHYGLRDQFPIRWLRGFEMLRRYDFCFFALLDAVIWQADLFYVWPLQGAALASRLGLSTALEIHDLPSGSFGPWLFRNFLRGSGARRLFPITDALRYWLAREYKTSLKEPFTIVSPLAVDINQYTDLPTAEEARRELGMEQAFTAGYTGHLYPGRGIDLLVELARRNPKMRFIWAGGEAVAIRLWNKRLSNAGVNNVRLMGFVPNTQLPLIQAACDVLMMPHERRVSASGGGDIARFTSPMKMFEYLATGRAILASDLPVLREVLNENNAVLIAPEDIDAWNGALRVLEVNEDKRRALGNQARKDAEKYTWVERARRTLEGIAD
jgi:glycosyltransferase involved in cell wall biosynthesis